MEKCKTCSAQASPFSKATVLGRYEVAYYRCDECGFVQTEDPYWLEEAYSNAITASDIGLVSRNMRLSLLTMSLIRLCFNPAGKFLDHAGGYGLLVRLMRDAGYDFHLYDKYCKNIFAPGFGVAEGENGCYDLVTAFEFLEHTRDPLEELRRILCRSRNILFTTEIHPASVPFPEDWWYYGLEHGQHISLFTLKSLGILAGKLSLNFYTNGTSIHLFTEKQLPPFLFNLALKYPIASLLKLLCRRPSFLARDFEAVRYHSSPSDSEDRGR